MKAFAGFRLLFALLIFSITLVWGGDSAKKSVQLRLAVPFRNFDELTRQDARLAMDLWTKEIIRNVHQTEGIQFSVQSFFLKNSYEQVDFSDQQSYDILLLSALDFLDFGLSQNWQPIAVTRGKGHFPEEYLVLIRAKNPGENLDDLRGQHIIFAKDQDARIILFWLDTMLKGRYHKTSREYFTKVEETNSASRALLSVFFGKADACVVGYNLYATMAELNPQIKIKLKVIERSPPFARGMVCLNKKLEPQIKRIVTNAILELPSSSRGQQILHFFNQSDLLLYKSEYLDSFRKLMDTAKARPGEAQ